MADKFDYDSAMAVAQTQFEKTVDNIWPFAVKALGDKNTEKYKTAKDKSERVYLLDIEGVTKNDHSRLVMLYELNHGRFWRAIPAWKAISDFSWDDKVLYANIILEKAKTAHKIKKESQYPGDSFGHVIIVENYNNGVLRDFISDDLLKEAAGRGFWEVANEYFTNSLVNNLQMIGGARERYLTIMEHHELIDLTHVDELYENPLLGGYWITDKYIKAFERSKSKLSEESAAKLVRPIIEKVFIDAFYVDPDGTAKTDNPAKFIAENLLPYEEYMKTEAVQLMLKERLKIHAKDYHTSGIVTVLHYIEASEAEKAEIVSAALPKIYPHDAKKLIDYKFPGSLLNNGKKEEVENAIMAFLQEQSRSPLGCCAGAMEEVIKPVWFAQRAMKYGLLDREKGSKFIGVKVTNYLNASSHTIKFTIAWENTLDPGYVNHELYSRFSSRIKLETETEQRRSELRKMQRTEIHVGKNKTKT
ncbi:MAG: hypothetical protein ABR981_00135 [Candidatus Micrarchaeaceae archaeon]|jgi:hypothetical protein